jgi:RNase adapter protein RapZ
MGDTTTRRDLMGQTRPERIMLLTGMSGAGKSTALKTLEDIGWEVVDNLPVTLLDRLLETPFSDGTDTSRPLAIGIDSRTRGFNAADIVQRIKRMRDKHDQTIITLFLDCSGAELERRYSETRRRHPLALDRPAADGIAREREMVSSLRRWADHVIDTTSSNANELKQDLRNRFAIDKATQPTLSVLSFGFARGLPRNADLVFDMRFLRNPYWDANLRPLSGLDAPVIAYVKADPGYETSISKIEELLIHLLPFYRTEGKAYVTVAIGCTGGQHRSVHVATRIAQALKDGGFSPILSHRDLGATGLESIEDGGKLTGLRELGLHQPKTG